MKKQASLFFHCVLPSIPMQCICSPIYGPLSDHCRWVKEIGSSLRTLSLRGSSFYRFCSSSIKTQTARFAQDARNARKDNVKQPPLYLPEGLGSLLILSFLEESVKTPPLASLAP
jgi:hypothetical protein